ncbi:plasminogen activator, urokinase b [Synchiropus splendidus]|uniref:plasminogen activator, urokinase b n=1 Tax=Synchiropus splendidus TaxID=270530 RepID=UPI00237E9A90|nr:plasminogen activator, urokinase b [Synchiropus splendidus]
MEIAILLLVLTAVPSSKAVFKRLQRDQSSPVFPSALYSSFRSSGGICLNGGTSVPSLRGEHMFCLCPDGFEGSRCETEKNVGCYEGLGLYYSGTQSRSESGHECLEWDPQTRERYLTEDVNAGRHNYCRNLEYKRRPWCYIWRNYQLSWEYCDIPLCNSDPVMPPLEPSEPTEPPEPETLTTWICGQRTRRRQAKIAGGTISTVTAHPWVAAIFWLNKSKQNVFRCGGSLISSCWVLSAAHCFPKGKKVKPRRFSVFLGKNALNATNGATEQNFQLEKIILHEGYNNTNGNHINDIALLKLKAKHGRCAMASTTVNTVCLPPPYENPQPGTTCEIAGYGKEKHSLWYNSQYLQEAQVNILDHSVCRQQHYYGNLVLENMFCAAHPEWSSDACGGDSGGPLVCQRHQAMVLYGVISWGDGCARQYKPGVYTKVSDYILWIAEKTAVWT